MLVIEDPTACGIGEGPKCCAFLVVHPDQGFCCGRTDPNLAATIVARVVQGTMGSKYAPTAEFPLCQQERPTANDRDDQ